MKAICIILNLAYIVSGRNAGLIRGISPSALELESNLAKPSLSQAAPQKTVPQPTSGNSSVSESLMFPNNRDVRSSGPKNSTVSNDWSYCTCPMDDEVGSLVFPERPTPPGWNLTGTLDMLNQLNVTSNQTSNTQDSISSLLEISLYGKTIALRRSDNCNCLNPWDNFKDPINSATCSVSGGVRLCLIKAPSNSTGLSASEVEKEARDLINQIDAAWETSNPADPTATAGQTADSLLNSNSGPDSSKASLASETGIISPLS